MCLYAGTLLLKFQTLFVACSALPVAEMEAVMFTNKLVACKQKCTKRKKNKSHQE